MGKVTCQQEPSASPRPTGPRPRLHWPAPIPSLTMPICMSGSRPGPRYILLPSRHRPFFTSPPPLYPRFPPVSCTDAPFHLSAYTSVSSPETVWLGLSLYMEQELRVPLACHPGFGWGIVGYTPLLCRSQRGRKNCGYVTTPCQSL